MSIVEQEHIFKNVGLHDFIKSLPSHEQKPEVHHRSTRNLFPILENITSHKTFDSQPDFLVAKESWNRIPQACKAKYIGTRMLQFDALADYLQKLHNLRLIITSACAIGFLWLLELSGHVFEDRPLVLVGSLLCLIGAITVVHAMNSRTIQMAYISVRTVAEMLRFLFFMQASGVEIRTRDCVPRRYRPIMGRVLLVVEQIEDYSESLPGHLMGPDEVKEAWFAGQNRYFISAANRENMAATRWEAVSIAFFFSGIVVLTASAVASFQGASDEILKYTRTLGPCFLALAGVSQFYAERRGFKANAERYRHSVHIYDTDPGATWNDIVREIGTEALHEVVDWYVASIEREISVPRG